MLHPITANGMKLVFRSVRMALVRMVLVTRAHTFPDDALALAAIKVHKVTQDAGWPSNPIDQDAHGIPFGPQVTPLPGLIPEEVALRLRPSATSQAVTLTKRRPSPAASKPWTR